MQQEEILEQIFVSDGNISSSFSFILILRVSVHTKTTRIVTTDIHASRTTRSKPTWLFKRERDLFFFRNGNFKDYRSSSKSYKKKSNYDDYSDNYYRKKRQYGSSVEKETTMSMVDASKLLERNKQTDYNQGQGYSYGFVQPAVPTVPEKIPTSLASPERKHHLPFRLCEMLLISVAKLCSGKTNKDNIAHPTDRTKYVACLSETNQEIMECPTGLIYNAAIDQCETVAKSESICEQERPCLNDGQCHQTSPGSFKCTCLSAWTGERCETPVSSCAAKPCGQGNECHSLKASDYQQDYVCLCNERQSYGLSCGASTLINFHLSTVERRRKESIEMRLHPFLLDTVPNPCLTATSEAEQYFPFAFSAQAFVQCNGDLLYVQPCAPGSVWNQEAKICDRLESPPAPVPVPVPADRVASDNYEVAPSTPAPSAYNRPTAGFGERIVTQSSTEKKQSEMLVDQR